jgi:hypothetical protein
MIKRENFYWDADGKAHKTMSGSSRGVHGAVEQLDSIDVSKHSKHLGLI